MSRLPCRLRGGNTGAYLFPTACPFIPLHILDDIWPAALNDGQRWRKFCAPLTKVLKGSMLLVTTRFAEVADIVGTMESFVLEGLKEDVFWDFFQTMCVWV